MRSLWEDGAKRADFERLERSISCDVLVIGGGLAGLLCAYMLERAGIDCVLAEAGEICGGITKNTTAKITSQHGLIYDKLIRRLGAERAGLYLRANEQAIERYRELCAGIDCDFEERDNYVYSAYDTEKLRRELAALKRLGAPAQYVSELPLPISVAGAVKLPRQAQFDPLKFARHIAGGLRIYEHTRVRELVGTVALTERGRISANRIVVATHFPFLNKHGAYFIKMYQERSYVLALEGAQAIDGMYVDEAKKGMSFRGYKDYLLLGGGGHRTGKKGGGWDELREFAARHYPQARERYHWAAQDCMTLDGAPYIGRYSAGSENLYVATGFNKWGMSSSMVAATLLCDMLQGKSSPFEAPFDPSRSILHPQLAANAAEAALSLVTPSVRRCPHLGCALKWNPMERSWDCPCHGSRFAENGRLLDNPATGDMDTR